MKLAGVFGTMLFAAIVLSALFMLKNATRAPIDEREVLSRWPQEVATALDEYDLPKLFDYFVDEFQDQHKNTKQTYKTYLVIEKNHTVKWKAQILSTQVEWDMNTPEEAKVQVRFDLKKHQTLNYEADLKLKKFGDNWKAYDVQVRKLGEKFN